MILSKKTVLDIDDGHPQAALIREQNDYLWGVKLADQEEFLEDPDSNVALIDPYGTGTKAFWRGLFETAERGNITIKKSGGGDREYPMVYLKASHGILTKFLAFMQEEVYTRNGITWDWDDDGKLAWQAIGGFLRITGQKAQDVVRVLYIGETVGRESARHMADRIVAWTSRRQW
jgi:hypothetical protein